MHRGMRVYGILRFDWLQPSGSWNLNQEASSVQFRRFELKFTPYDPPQDLSDVVIYQLWSAQHSGSLSLETSSPIPGAPRITNSDL